MPGGGRFYGSLECFSVILPNVQPGSLTRVACDAVGYLYFMHKTPSRNLATRHQRAYGQSLQQLRLAVDHPVAQRQDETLLAVWLLCLYEVIIVLMVEKKCANPIANARNTPRCSGFRPKQLGSTFRSSNRTVAGQRPTAV
jgi:hypothetical protein